MARAPESIEIPEDSVLRYETALKANKFILIVHGTVKEVEKATVHEVKRNHEQNPRQPPAIQPAAR